MRSFLIQVGLYVFVFWLLNMAIGYELSTYETQDLYEKKQFFPALRWEEYYEQEEAIDLLILGSSHAYRSFDPLVIERAMSNKTKVFNFGSSAQSPVTSYYVLKEVLQKHRPKTVVFDIYYMVFSYDDQIKNGRFNWQHMQASEAKKAFLNEGFSTKERVSLSLFPSLVYKTYLKNKINSLLGRPIKIKSKGSYHGKGFVSTPDTLSLYELKNSNQYDFLRVSTTALTKRNFEYLKKIKDLCQSENIQLIFTTTPIPEISVEKIDNYLEFHQLFDTKAKKWGVPYFDYNVNRIPALNDASHYYDDDHLNAAGAAVFSTAFAKDISKL